MTKSILDLLDQLETFATAELWRFKHSGDIYGSSIELENGGILMTTTSYGKMREDAQLVVWMRNNIRALIDVAKAAEDYVEEINDTEASNINYDRIKKALAKLEQPESDK